MRYVSLTAYKKVVHTEDIVPSLEEPFAQVRSKEASATSYENFLHAVAYIINRMGEVKRSIVAASLTWIQPDSRADENWRFSNRKNKNIRQFVPLKSVNFLNSPADRAFLSSCRLANCADPWCITG